MTRRCAFAPWLPSSPRERGARIVEPLGLRPWGTREFALLDPDGNRFRIGQPRR